ncbi:putative transcriptional elongation protein Spt4 [Trichodelitschia bisporula]|uniref:Transcription elongation factor SPT4 n=1 Tax=Trichodelitschia bisporula TaxID=703511 RepID=A0A6G1HMH5_9PEZI|nr:putative transcriptional elongation protein Spt4 [Trichodelitschia bisporula]
MAMDHSTHFMSGMRNLRACMVCSIILPQAEFNSRGCPNCETVLQLRGSPETVNECTSSNYSGILALTNPARSWAAKWQRLDGYVQGMYAIQVIGVLPDDMIESLEAAGIRYVPRDGSRDDEADGERDTLG